MPQLTHSPARIVRQLLVDLDLGTLYSENLAWPIFAEKEPDSPDQLITVYTTEGISPGKSMQLVDRVEYRGIQMRARSVDDSGRRKLLEIKTALDTEVLQTNVTLESSVYLIQCLLPVSDVILLQRGEVPSSQRRLYTLNALLTVTQTT